MASNYMVMTNKVTDYVQEIVEFVGGRRDGERLYYRGAARQVFMDPQSPWGIYRRGDFRELENALLDRDGREVCYLTMFHWENPLDEEEGP